MKRKRGRKGNLDSDNYNKVAGQNCFRWSSRIIRIRKWSMRKKKRKKKNVAAHICLLHSKQLRKNLQKRLSPLSWLKAQLCRWDLVSFSTTQRDRTTGLIPMLPLLM